MNKKITLVISLTLNLVLIIILTSVVVFLQMTGSFKDQKAKQQAEASEDLSPRVPKPIQLELMSDQEKTAFELASTTANRIQVLERDKDGNVTAYKIIRSDAEIMTSY